MLASENNTEIIERNTAAITGRAVPFFPGPA